MTTASFSSLTLRIPDAEIPTVDDTAIVSRNVQTCALERDGFTLIHPDDLFLQATMQRSLMRLATEFETLPEDPYGRGANRFRAHSRGVFMPWNRRVEWLPPAVSEDGHPQTEYYQGRYHPGFTDTRRRFRAVSHDVLTGCYLQHLVQSDFARTFWDEYEARQPHQLGISLVKLLVAPGELAAFSTPDHLHQDGERFTFAHLFRRENCIGGENAIAAPIHAGVHPDELEEKDIFARFTLEQAHAGYAIHDPAVSHHVGSIRAEDPARPAERSIILIDFTPLLAEHHV
ncbi:2OG-Fe dioxygenase family protein [Methylobacterium sp. SyP6R]|uniref:2OG-Fe dioxygenase family protein n=1 Tax=Methylobacterium sp. SyP6R TaxID=2718876 RepID=UPI001F1A8DD8|nr:2OG-Fe dioxygenase family protein [Methylobacterium sp. SyP6R]MCF4126195.1 2OG-Fe dioxygenase family protein [Methylobacterium sp. SyP6R]